MFKIQKNYENRVHIMTTAMLLMVAFFATVPFVADAQSLQWFQSLIQQMDNIVRVIVIPLLIGLAVMLFIWGVIKYFIYGSDDESARETGRAFMLYGLIGLTAIVAVWGFVNLLLQILGVNVQTAPTINNYLP